MAERNGAVATVSGFVDGCEVAVEVSAELADRFREDRLKLGWRTPDVLSWMIDRVDPTRGLTETSFAALLDRLEREWGLRKVRSPLTE